MTDHETLCKLYLELSQVVPEETRTQRETILWKREYLFERALKAIVDGTDAMTVATHTLETANRVYPYIGRRPQS